MSREKGSRPSRLAAAVILLLLALPACGKKGPPQAPLRIRPASPRALQARQRGEIVWVSLREPSARTDGSDLPEGALLRIYLLPGDWGERPAPGRSPSVRRAGGPTWALSRDRWPEYRSGGRLEIPLRLESLSLPGAPPGGAAGRRIAIAAEVQEGKRKHSELAGPVRLTLCTAPPPPPAVNAEMTEPGIRLAWDPPSVEGVRAHVYRASGGEEPGEKIHATAPASAGAWTDRGVVTGTVYTYELRFAAGGEQSQCESTAVRASLRAVDTFPPAPPRGLAAAAEPGGIRLFWTPGDELDLAGYLIYRKAGEGGEFIRLTEAPITETTWADEGVEPGVRYTYVVTAVDGALPPNESARSEPASEILP